MWSAVTRIVARSPGRPCARSARAIFFPRIFSDLEVRHAFRTALIEQHPRSPHAYSTPSHQAPTQGVVVCAGASDGFFAASVLKQGGSKIRLVLFEPDASWSEPLRRTFADDSARITIREKKLGSRCTADQTTLDAVADEFGEISFVEADVEGAEPEIIAGGKRALGESRSVRCSICCYHAWEHEKALRQAFEELGFSTSTSRGYFVFSPRAPFLRRAVVYAARDTARNGAKGRGPLQ